MSTHRSRSVGEELPNYGFSFEKWVVLTEEYPTVSELLQAKHRLEIALDIYVDEKDV